MSANGAGSPWGKDPASGSSTLGVIDTLVSGVLRKSAWAGRILVVYVAFWLLLAVGLAIYHLGDPEGAERCWGIRTAEQPSGGKPEAEKKSASEPAPRPQPDPHWGDPSTYTWMDNHGNIRNMRGEIVRPANPPPPRARRAPIVCPGGTTFGG